MTKDKIISHLKAKKEEFLKKYQVSELALFGSYSRGENVEKSDIDIAIVTPLADYFLLYTLKEELEKQFDKKVDLVRVRENMNKTLKKRIEKDAIYV